MNPLLTISQAQLAELTRPPRNQHREQVLLEMAAFWQLSEEQWRPQFVNVLTYEERKEFFRQVYDWAIRVGLSEHSHLLAAATLLLRAFCQGWPAEYQALARGFIEADPDNPEAALRWLQSAFDEENG